MKSRIKQIRNHFGYTQEVFASKINLSRNFIAQVEIGSKVPSERTIADICKEFGINEDWLRNGTGGDDNIFVVPVVSHDDEIAAFFAKILEEEGETAQKRWAYAYSKLPPELWEQLDKIMQAIIAGYK